MEERTNEIQIQNENLNQQNEEILAQRDEIESQKSVLIDFVKLIVFWA